MKNNKSCLLYTSRTIKKRSSFYDFIMIWKSERLQPLQKLVFLPVSYTHLDVYKRQYQNFPLKLTLSKAMEKELRELQKQFMPEDTKAGLIQSFLDKDVYKRQG